MYSVKSLGHIHIKDRGLIFFIECPTERAERNFESMKEAIGEYIEIDGKIYQPKGYEMLMPGYEIQLHEKIGVLVDDIVEK